MTDLARAKQLRGRMSHLLTDQGIFAWAHRIVGIVSGLIWTGTWIFVHGFKTPYGAVAWLGRGFYWLTSAIFFVAALPYVFSYWTNFRWVTERSGRTILFMLVLLIIGSIVNGAAIALLLGGYSLYWSILLLPAQASAYGFLGEPILGVDDRVYLPDNGQ